MEEEHPQAAGGPLVSPPVLRRRLTAVVVVGLLLQALWGALPRLTAEFTGADDDVPGRFTRWSETAEERRARHLGELAATVELAEQRTPRRAHLLVVDPLQPRAALQREWLAFWLFPRSVHASAELAGTPAGLRRAFPPGSYLLIAPEAGPFPFGEVGPTLAEAPLHRLVLLAPGDGG